MPTDVLSVRAIIRKHTSTPMPLTLRNAGALLRAVVVTSTLLVAVVVRALLRRLARAPTATQKLAAVWNGATEIMLDVPRALPPRAAAGADARVVLVPERALAAAARAWGARARAATTPLPAALSSAAVVFALTAFDPPGETRTLAENTRANGALAAELARLAPRPAAAWRSFGVNVDEAWREDGFCVAFADGGASVARARAAVVALAARHGQGAIFEYTTGEDGATMRATVPVLAGRNAAAGPERMVRLELPEAPPTPALAALIARAWAGPAAFPSDADAPSVSPEMILAGARALAARLDELRAQGRQLEAECDAERMQQLAQQLARLAESGDESSAEAARLAATLDGLFLAGDGDDPRYNMVH